jgi:hypothetical protein
MSTTPLFARARAVADAVLLEGYALYPYRRSSLKNQLRWQFGVLVPRRFSEAGGGEPWWMQTECLVEGDAPVTLEGRLRFLRLRRRRVDVPTDHGSGGADDDGELRPVESVEVNGQLLVAWDEGEICEVDFTHPIEITGQAEQVIEFDLPGDVSTEELRTDGVLAARVTHTRAPLAGKLLITVEPVAAQEPLCRLHIRIENRTAWESPSTSRDQALTASCLGVHLLLALPADRFLSLVDAPEWAEPATKACRNIRLHPVLACEPGRRDLVLSAPIILSDHPAVAPESPGDLFDATEIDEILTLRTLTLTDDEKRQARATDPRVAALIDRVDGAPPELLQQLHGVFRAPHPIFQADPSLTSTYRAGTRVRLHPGSRRTDAQDMFLAGCIAVIERVERDVDDQECLAVLLEDDPAAELNRWHGRFLYFYPDEVEPLADGATG